MSRTLITGFGFLAVVVFAVLTISSSGMNPGYSNVAQAVELSETSKSHGQYEGELQKLLIERKTLLSHNVESMKIFVDSGRVDIGEYRDANIALLRAEMDLCKTKEERLDILEKIIQVHKKYEQQVAKKIAFGQSSKIELNKAKVAILETRIELIKEKLKGQSS